MSVPQVTSLAPTRSVTFQGLDTDTSDFTEEPAATAVRSHPTQHTTPFSRRFSERLRQSLSGRSAWRFPTTAGSLPRYAQRAFRMKTFGLMACQLIVVLGFTVLVDYFRVWDIMRPQLGETITQVIFYVIGALNFVSILALAAFKDHFPLNYLLLGCSTLMSGAFWGLTRGMTGISIHIQILAILVFSMCGATVVSSILTDSKLSGNRILISMLMPGWCIASAINAILCKMIFHMETLEVLGAAAFSLLLLCILLVDVGKLLVRCRPDDFMAVVVSMNSTLMVVVSIPFFVLTFCFLHTSEAMTETDDVPRITGFDDPSVLAPELAAQGRAV